MDAVWSQYIQGCMTLYASRRLRFRDRFRDRYLPLLDLPDKPLRILEIGCGPGALAEALHRWYPGAEIIGLDRDREFVGRNVLAVRNQLVELHQSGFLCALSHVFQRWHFRFSFR